MTGAAAPRPALTLPPGPLTPRPAPSGTSRRRQVVHVWVAPPAAGAALVGLLDDEERDRRDALPPPQRNAFTTGRALLRLAVGELAAVAPGSVVLAARCSTCGGAHGGVEVVHPRGVAVSVSRSGPLVAVAVLQAGDRAGRRRVGRVGIDVVATCTDSGTGALDRRPADRPHGAGDASGFEVVALGPRDRRRLAEASAAARPHLLATAWARTEAVLKATGQGLRADPRGVRVLGRDGRARRVRRGSLVLDVLDLALPVPGGGTTSSLTGTPQAGAVAAVAVGRRWWCRQRLTSVTVHVGTALLARSSDDRGDSSG